VSSIIASLLLALLLALGLILPHPESALAALPPGNAITDPGAILRDALPEHQADLQSLQHRLEGSNDDLRARRWSSIQTNCERSRKQLQQRRGQIISSLPSDRAAEGQTLLDQLDQQLEQLCSASAAQDRDAFLNLRSQALNSIGAAETLVVGSFPFNIPAEFNDLPRLLGRATVAFHTNKGNITATVDGFNAPLTAGAFVDLAQKGFYNGLPFTRAEDFYVLQTGDPKGPAEGYVDPQSKTERRVPLEIMVPGADGPLYNQTFEDVGMFKTTPTLPFATLGTLGWAHSDEALNDGSSQFFFFLYEAELTPAGLNLVDGRYAAFGYVVDGFDVLEQLGVDDRIESVKVISGAQFLQAHG
jgi:peptidylprolyl isomerase